MQLAIMQPTYLPWIGYFDLLSKADVFVFLDDVQFSRRSWQQRNRLLLEGREKLITVPVRKSDHSGQLLMDAEISEGDWADKHLKLIDHAYKKARFGGDVLARLKRVYEDRTSNLCDLNIGLIIEIASLLGVDTEVVRSSELSIDGKKSEKLVNICKALNASKYLSAAGSKEYIETEGRFRKEGIEVSYHDFYCRPYRQVKTHIFIPYLSVVDFLSNVDPVEYEDHIYF